MTVTIVDDCDTIRQICNVVARRMDFRTECFVDGQEFLDNYTPKAGVVLLGITMPRKNGIEVLIELRELGWNLNVVAMSAGYGKKDTPYFLDLGAKSFLPKPFRPAEVATEINRALGRAV
ncbi:response regulator [Gemmata sp. G18]|uniref:Response regulator n=1 Tax=Gemmata palustris TaxID=2822762 RepID=A0ABS5BY76_9BACT|nr:response regulator [Gemmata palustris]MBP3958362.1 response regulator [Gemmata palustris]